MCRVNKSSLQIDGNDEVVRQQMLQKATRRASKWMSYQNAIVEQLQGQVGGLSKNKRRMMRLAPDYVMKHVRRDHRGIREVAFYEAVKAASSQKTGTLSSKTGNRFLGKCSPIEVFDMLSMFLAICLQDPVVASSEQALIKSWKASRKESELLRRLSNFVPAYYGVVNEDVILPSLQNDADDDAEVCMPEAYILMQDVTAKFSKPCAIDIKMGTMTYEPDATAEKRERELEKYPPQAEFGMRIVSMRIYDPGHPHANDEGYRTFPKTFGRSLQTTAELLSALRTFFSSGTAEGSANEQIDSEGKLRKRVVTNILMQLKLLRSWFDDNDCLAFYASSLFFCYDGDASRGDATSTKLIDFGHVRREAGGDPGYRLGLRTIISLLTSILDDAQPSAE